MFSSESSVSVALFASKTVSSITKRTRRETTSLSWIEDGNDKESARVDRERTVTIIHLIRFGSKTVVIAYDF